LSDACADLAMFYLRQIKENVKDGVLNEKAQDFIYNILEREKMVDGQCKLTKNEFDYLARIHKKCMEKKK
jgi:hypothetical protein